MFDVLRVKPFDLEPVYVSWKNPPIFNGKKGEDPVAWLAAIKAGCVDRKIPKEHWYQVGRHYLGKKPRERFDELGRVMQKMTGNKHVWNWKKFKIAVQNLGCEYAPLSPRKFSDSLCIGQSPSAADTNAPKQISKQASKQTPEPVSQRPTPKKAGSWWILGKSDKSDKEDESCAEVVVAKSKSSPSQHSIEPGPEAGEYRFHPYWVS